MRLVSKKLGQNMLLNFEVGVMESQLVDTSHKEMLNFWHGFHGMLQNLEDTN